MVPWTPFKLFSRKPAKAAGFKPPITKDHLQEALFFAEEKGIREHLSDLAGRKVLEISPNQRGVATLLQEKGAAFVAVLGDSVLSHWENLPFLEGAWDFVLVRSAYLKGGFRALTRLLREVGRVLKSGGDLLLSDLHPFSVMVQAEHLKSPVGEEGIGPGFERTFKVFRETGLHLEGVREVFFEGSLQKFFGTPEEKKFFEGLRRTPLLISFFLKKV